MIPGTSSRTPSPAQSGWRDGWYVVPHEVTWRDLDAIGHVNNAVYFSYFEWGRTKYWFALQELEGSPVGATDLSFIVARAECDFKDQLGLTDVVEIRTRIGELRTTSVVFEHQIVRADGRTAAVGKVVVVLYSWERKTKMPITSELRSRIEAFQQEE